MLSIFGIRHHGPGSSLSLLGALEAMAPDLVLVEGPPDADDLIPFVADKALVPPAAILIYDPDQPRHAVYYPFADFSPEWQALRFALKHEIPARFMDLAQAHRLAEPPESDKAQTPQPEGAPFDPFEWVAKAAGYSDGERWWERYIEQRPHSEAVFTGILELMTALREDAEAAKQPDAAQTHLREAAMREIIRQAQAEGFEKIAVVCGAWHAPALQDLATAEADAALLKGLPEVKTSATWVPWTYDRLAYRSGYGAGIESPGWYDHLWTTHERIVENWMVKAARLMRDEGLDVSPAHAIEAARLAEALAALRGHPLPGLPETEAAIRAVFCFGEEAPLQLVREKLIISQRMGAVPPDAPAVPLVRDLEAIQRRTRFKPNAAAKTVDLDLRKPLLLERSHLLHRLNILGISWGELHRTSSRNRGTFHEIWRVEWKPEFAVDLIEASMWGNTVLEAAGHRIRARAAQSPDLPSLTRLVEAAILANLEEPMPDLVAELQHRAAASHDITHLMGALPPLANVLRYGDVRKTGVEMVSGVVSELMTRICVGLVPSCLSLDDDAAQVMFEAINATQNALDILRGRIEPDDWLAALKDLAENDGVHGMVRGRACQILFEDPDQEAWVGVQMSRALSPGTEAPQAGAWLEGFLANSGQVLIHHPRLWSMVNAWVMSLSPDLFKRQLPLLRRTFSSLQGPEKRKLGEMARAGGAASRAVVGEQVLDEARTQKALTMVMKILEGEGRHDG